MKQQTILDCRIAGFNKDGIRMIAIYDSQNDQLTISKALPYQPPKDPYQGKTAQQVARLKELEKNTVIVVDNNNAFPKWDLHFVENENLDEAINAYYLFERTGSLVLGDDVRQQYNPEGIIEVRKMDISGKKYELNTDEVTNGNIAVMVACWAAKRARNASVLVEEGQDPTQDDIDSFDVPFCV